jgi:glycosyltransferase involved in cell wall biosynthesis
MPELAYDARYITSEPAGIGQLCLELLRGFARMPEGPRLLVLIGQGTALPRSIAEAQHLEFYRVPWAAHGLRDQLLLPGLLRHYGVRLLHGVDCFNPLPLRGINLVVTIHDLIPLTCAGLLRRSKKVRLLPLWKSWLRLQCARAAAVVTVSQHSAGDIARLLRVPQRKIHVIYNPTREWGSIEPVDAFRQRFGLHGRVISYVGRHDPYKNTVGLIRAMAIVRRLYPSPIRLVVTGTLDARYPEAYAEVGRLGLTDTVVFTGYLHEASLGALYKTSDVFVFPSLYEGFGLPPLEAMSFGTPVVSSNRTALPEVLGNAALFADPENPQALAETIARVLTNPELASQLRQAGLQHAAEFPIRRAAEQHLELYRKILAKRDQNEMEPPPCKVTSRAGMISGVGEITHQCRRRVL